MEDYEASKRYYRAEGELFSIVDPFVRCSPESMREQLLGHNILELRLVGFYLLLLDVCRGRVEQSVDIIISAQKFIRMLKPSVVSPKCLKDAEEALQKAIQHISYEPTGAVYESAYDKYLPVSAAPAPPTPPPSPVPDHRADPYQRARDKFLSEIKEGSKCMLSTGSGRSGTANSTN